MPPNKLFAGIMLLQTSTLLQTLTLISMEILHSHRHCDYTVRVNNAAEPCLHFLTGGHFSHPKVLLSASNNGRLQNTEDGLLSPHFGPCYLFVHEVDSDGGPLSNWPETMYLGGSMHQNFHVFLMMNTRMTDLLGFAKSTRRLYHAVYFRPDNEHVIEILKISSSGLTLKHILTHPTVDEAGVSNKGIQVFNERPNLEKTTVRALQFCGKNGCQEAVNELRRNGRWHSLTFASMHELIQLVNGTMVVVDVFTPQVDGQNEQTGEWDDWTQPLIDGDATISFMIRTSVEKSKFVFTTVPIAFDHVVFVTRKAREDGSAHSWAKLLKPLTREVWLCCLASILALLVAMKCALSFSSIVQGKGEAGKSAQLLAVILKPIFGQPSIVCEKGTAGNDSIFRLLLVTWLLSLIVLVFGYTSTMTSHIVRPSFENLPKTFQELANSDLKLFGTHWHGNIQKYFESLNNSMGKRILSRVVDTDTSIFNPECLKAVSEPRQACISLYMLFKLDESGLLLDQRGREVFVMSKDQPLFSTAKFSVSKFHPAVFVKFNRMLSSLSSTGVIDAWRAEAIGWSLRIAKRKAKAEGRTREAPVEVTQTASAFLLELLLIGGSTASVMFMIEAVACRLGFIKSIEKIVKKG